jgi:hypothetical protein
MSDIAFNVTDVIAQSQRVKGDRRILSLNNSLYIMALRLIAFLLSLLNTTVLASPRLKDNLYKYLMLISIADFLYSGSVFVMGVFARLCYAEDPIYCTSSVYHSFLVIYILLSEYVTSCLAFLNIVTENFITLQRIVLISNMQSFLRTVSFKRVCFGLSLTIFSIYVPVLFMSKIDTIEIKDPLNGHSKIDYRLNGTDFGRSPLAKSIVTTLNMIRIGLVTVVLLILNILAIIKFRQYLNRKQHLSKISILFLFLVSNRNYLLF